jgi:hypothetical protein
MYCWMSTATFRRWGTAECQLRHFVTNVLRTKVLVCCLLPVCLDVSRWTASVESSCHVKKLCWSCLRILIFCKLMIRLRSSRRPHCTVARRHVAADRTVNCLVFVIQCPLTTDPTFRVTALQEHFSQKILHHFCFHPPRPTTNLRCCSSS